MQDTCTLLELLYSGHEPAEIATQIEKGKAWIRDRYGRLVVAEGTDRQKLLDQVAHHNAMFAERNKPWKYWSEAALDYWAFGKSRPNRDYGGEQPPEIDRAWLKIPYTSAPKDISPVEKHPAGEVLANRRWDPIRKQKKEAFEQAKTIIERSNLMHHDVASTLENSGFYPSLERTALLKVAAEACDALGVGYHRVKGRRTRP